MVFNFTKANCVAKTRKLEYNNFGFNARRAHNGGGCSLYKRRERGLRTYRLTGRRDAVPYILHPIPYINAHRCNSQVKGGGTSWCDGGTVKSDNLYKTIPQSASLTAPFTQGSLWHKVILRWIFICLLLIGNSLFWIITRLSRGFCFTTRKINVSRETLIV